MKIKLSDTIALLFFLGFINLAAFSQKAPMKYGKINKADLEMKVYPLDTSAAAAVLCDYGYFDSNQFQFVRTLRIKIFKKEGLDWANKTFPGDSKGNVRGITFNLENGQIIESKLKSESIFKERVTEDYYRLRIAMPNVKEGSMMDMEFVYPTLPSEWRFQQEIPVRWSELIIETSPYFEFRKNFTGFERLAETSDMRWVAKDVPAFQKEPYMNDVSNYITKFEFELLRVSFPGSDHSSGFYKEYSTDWSHVVGRLMSNNYFGGTLSGCGFLNDIVKEIESKYTDPLDKLKAGQAAIKKAVKWNKEEALFTTVDGLSQPFKKKIGNSADINLMLVQLLRKLKLNVDLIVLSTRSNGMLSYSPSMDKLNYVVGYVTIGDKKYFVDATDENIPVGILPVQCLNLRGRIIFDKKNIQEEFIIKPEKKYRQVIQTDFKLETDLVLTGKMNRLNYDYAALDAREEYEQFNSQEEFLKDFENDHQGLNVIKCDIKNKDSIYLPFIEEYEVKIKNKVTNAGNLLYINPMLYEQMESNPFKVEERKYPVDFIYPMEKLYVFKLTLPESMQVSEIPKPLIIKLPDNSASIQYQVSNVGQILQLVYKFNITKPNYTNEDYSNLRAFFSELVKKHTEPIIIKPL